MRASTCTKIVKEADGRKKRVRTVTYHCETCNTFVRSEDQGETQEQ